MKTLHFTSKKIKLILVGLFISTISFSQNYIDNTTLNTQKLSEIFKNAYVEVLQVNSSYLKIKDKYETFVDLDSQNRYISISGNYALQPNLTKMEILEFINKLNTEVALVKSYYGENNNSINYVAYLWIEKGFTDATLIKMLKSYNLALDLILQKDPDYKYLK
ncbi:YbjN domain-containing protein [Lutibacter maritimus]|jgi:hypothetical protein|uniref:Putative sensory transduction regulator n=1 Tax=Lutibacter maritimus TaxID=593133 RepID=A0A1I6RJ49_9FLAO|nr:YbjN domain-containing protein [Lutibacter maritimus]SFS64695.1 Putative sensory transduction regulator [Lutibacter maritimus]